MKSPSEIVGKLDEAVALLDREAVAGLSSELVAHIRETSKPLPVELATQVLSTLRRKRFFPQMQAVAEALIQSDQGHPIVRRQYAQSLIDQGAPTAACAVLKELLPETGVDRLEDAEIRGLIGRARKQHYVNALRAFAPRTAERRVNAERHATSIRTAIEYYHQAFLENEKDNYWQGINVVACALRAARDGLGNAGVVDPLAIASEILDRIEAKGEKASVWEIATAIEACVALDDGRTAAGWGLEYVQQRPRQEGSYADAFEIASTLRQLTEVWELDAGDGIGRTLLPVLSGGLLDRDDGFISMTPDELRRPPQSIAAIRDAVRKTKNGAILEKVFGTDAFVSLNMYEAGYRRARTIARIGLETAHGVGTGFLVCGADLSERFDEQLMLVTNSHVLSAKEENQAATRPEEAVITFEGLPARDGSSQSYSVASVVWESSPNELDTTVVILDRPIEGVTKKDCSELAPILPVNNQKGRVYIIGHPNGGGLSYSIQDNLLLDYEDPKLHYRSPTEGGSSGSPLYNAQWKLIGIHHAGSREMPRLRKQSGTYEANEGIWIQSIRRALESH